MSRRIALLLCLFVLPLLPAAAHAQSCVYGNVSAVYGADPTHPSLWKYCVDVRWDLGQYEASHIDLFLELPDCPCICDPVFIRFDPIAGHSTNTSDVGATCELDYYGDYVCKGDPSLPGAYDAPAVKFEPLVSTCGPGVSGYGTFCFYSPMPPQPSTVADQGLAIKHGLEYCYGPLEGQLPGCDCVLPTQVSTWGALKSVYR